MVDATPPELSADAPPQPETKPRNKLFTAIKIAASIGLIAWIVSTANLADVFAALKQVDVRWLLFAVALQFVGAGILSFRWKGLLDVQGVSPGWGYLYKSTLVANFFRQFLPSIIGGDVIRGHDAWKAGATWPVALMSLLLDRLLGLLALALLAMVAVLFSDELSAKLPSLRWWLIAAFVGLSVVLSFLLLPRRAGSTPRTWPSLIPGKIAAKLSSIGEAMTMYQGKPQALWRGLGLSVFLQINVVTFYWALSQALGLEIDYGSWFVIAPIAIFVMMIPLSINGIGVREAIFIFLLSQWDVTNSTALALAWLEYGIFLAFGLVGGLVYMLRKT
ncbi:MAG: lysylphosphatidylglycerol synthase transmembrane domain-containing protein [Pseudomonadota bacterium]